MRGVNWFGFLRYFGSSTYAHKVGSLHQANSQVVGNQIYLFNKGVESSKMKIEKT